MPIADVRVPSTFEPHISGLIVPSHVARKRQVFTKEEWRHLHRTSRIFAKKGVKLLMECDEPGCPGEMQSIEVPGDGMVLRCGCTDRVFQKAF